MLNEKDIVQLNCTTMGQMGIPRIDARLNLHVEVGLGEDDAVHLLVAELLQTILRAGLYSPFKCFGFDRN